MICPIVSPADDHIRSLCGCGVKALHLSTAGELEGISALSIQAGDVPFVFTSPDVLLSSKQWRAMLLSPVYAERLVAVVVDESHCITKW